ncbi:MAG: hypothetical protein AAF557_28150 [Pseudomonadota bacterium]
MTLTAAMLVSALLVSEQDGDLLRPLQIRGTGGMACEVLFNRGFGSSWRDTYVRQWAYGYFAARNDVLEVGKKNLGATQIDSSRIISTMKLKCFDHPEATVAEIVRMLFEDLPEVAR